MSKAKQYRKKPVVIEAKKRRFRQQLHARFWARGLGIEVETI